MNMRKALAVILAVLYACCFLSARAESDNDDEYFRGLFIPYVHQFNHLTLKDFEDVLKWNRFEYDTGEYADGTFYASVPANIGRLECWFSPSKESENEMVLACMIYSCDKYSVHASGNAVGRGATITLKYARRVMSFNTDMDIVISFYNDYCHGSIK